MFWLCHFVTFLFFPCLFFLFLLIFVRACFVFWYLLHLSPYFFPRQWGGGGGNFPRYRPLYSHYYSLLLQLCRYEECDVDHIYWAFHWCNHWWWSPETCTLQAVWLRVRRFFVWIVGMNWTLIITEFDCLSFGWKLSLQN